MRALFSAAVLLGLVACAPAQPVAPTSAPATAVQAKPTTAAATSPAAQAGASPAASPAGASPAASPAAAAGGSPVASPAAAASPAASPAAKPAASPAAAASPSPVAQQVASGPNGERLVEQSNEARFQLDLAVPDAALAALLPSGFTLNVATQGAAKDANVRLVFIDRVTINGPTGAPLGSGSNRLVYFVSPVRDPNGNTAQLVVGGLTEDPADAPGPFGNYLLATTHTMERSMSSGQGPIQESQDWVFEAATGEHLELHVTYQRGNAQRNPPADTRFYSARTPTFYQLSRQEQVLDILRNVTTTPPDRVRDFSMTCSGGSYARLCDGSEKVLSWDSILWINRAVFVP
jgi:hypothetical protein